MLARSTSNFNKLYPPIVTKSHHNFLVSVFGINLTKADIWKCPVRKFEGQVHIITSEDDHRKSSVAQAIQRVMSSKVVGFDTETAVTFPRNNLNKHHIGLIQIAIDSDVILWRLQRRRRCIWKDFPHPLRELLANSNITKVGNGTYDDLKDLYEYYDVTVSNMVDNQAIAKDIGYNKIGLVPLAAQLFGWRISKSEQISNWEASKLSKSQIDYASTDAWASLMIYYELSKMADLLQKSEQIKGTSSFHHILQQETKFDTDFLSSLDFFNEKFHTRKGNLLYDSLVKRRKQRLSFDCRDYEVNKIQRLSGKQFPLYDLDVLQSPFIYKVGNSYAVA